MSRKKRGGNQARARRYTWQGQTGEVSGALIEVRREGQRCSVFVPMDQALQIADRLVDIVEQIEREEEAGDAARAA